MFKEGDQAPDFVLKDKEGKVVKLSDFRGRWVVLYFYPRDMTTGCTKEACGFRDSFGYFKDKRAVILGVSMDSEESHRKFSEKFGLPFTLLSDRGGRVSRSYGVYQKKKFYGKEFWGIKRMTFLIDKQGRIKKIWDKVSVDRHHDDVLTCLE